MNIEHEPGAQRFVARVDGGEAEVSYTDRKEGVIDLVHTFVPPEARGQGLAEALVEAAFKHARDNGLKVKPVCPFVRKWLEDNPGQRDIVAA